MILFSKYVALANIAIILTLRTIAHAAPITANVIGSSVGDKGTVITEYRAGYEWDGDNAAQDGAYTDRADFYYNLTGDTQFRMFINRVNSGTDDSDVTSVFIEPVFQIFNQQRHGFDGAILTGLAIADGDNGAHLVRTILSATLPIRNGYARHNSVIGHQFGSESVDGLRYEARWRIMQHAPILGEHTDIGVEMFNNFDNIRTTASFDSMIHRAGPVMTGKITSTLAFQTGVLAGLSDNAPDTAAKFWLSYTF